MSNTQKNWNDFWDNYEPSRNDIVYKNINERENHSNFGFSHIIIAFCITITIGCIILIAATLNDIDNYIITVKNTDLSNEYNEYKNKAVEKLKIARSWINTEDVEKRNELIKQYNDINSIEYLAKAFDKAGVEYWLIDENHINFYYKNQ